MTVSDGTPLEFRLKPVLYSCSNAKGIEQLVKSSKAISRDKDFVLLFDHKEEVAPRVLPALVNAMIRMKDGTMRAREVQIEMLLLLCGTMNVGKALKEMGAKTSKRFFVFATSMAIFTRFSKANQIRNAERVPLKFDVSAAGDVAITELSKS